MTPIAGYEHLTTAEQKLFVRAHNKYLGSFKDAAKRNDYILENVRQVTPNPQENAIDVEFENGEKQLYKAPNR